MKKSALVIFNLAALSLCIRSYIFSTAAQVEFLCSTRKDCLSSG